MRVMISRVRQNFRNQGLYLYSISLLPLPISPSPHHTHALHHANPCGRNDRTLAISLCLPLRVECVRWSLECDRIPATKQPRTFSARLCVHICVSMFCFVPRLLTTTRLCTSPRERLLGVYHPISLCLPLHIKCARWSSECDKIPANKQTLSRSMDQKYLIWGLEWFSNICLRAETPKLT